MHDLRIPIGAFFLALGILLAIAPATGAPLTEAPVNLYTGVCSVIFGGSMLGLGLRRK
jgi:hypothetical protein